MAAPTDARPTLAAPDDDPWLWLEEVEGGARPGLGRGPERRHPGAPGRRPLPRRPGRGARRRSTGRTSCPSSPGAAASCYNFWQDAAQPRGVWRRTTLDSYRAPAPDWEVLLDLDALARAEGEDWVWQGATSLPGTHDLAVLRLSRGGGDAVVLREFDLRARRFVPDGFALPEAKGGVDWLDRDTLLLSSAFGGRAWRRARAMRAPCGSGAVAGIRPPPR
jgi:prolyl oligopeptidase